jgi:hypothetical protein
VHRHFLYFRRYFQSEKWGNSESNSPRKCLGGAGNQSNLFWNCRSNRPGIQRPRIPEIWEPSPTGKAAESWGLGFPGWHFPGVFPSPGIPWQDSLRWGKRLHDRRHSREFPKNPAELKLPGIREGRRSYVIPGHVIPPPPAEANGRSGELAAAMRRHLVVGLIERRGYGVIDSPLLGTCSEHELLGEMSRECSRNCPIQQQMSGMIRLNHNKSCVYFHVLMLMMPNGIQVKGDVPCSSPARGVGVHHCSFGAPHGMGRGLGSAK